MENEADKLLRFKRDIEKLKMASIKDEGYVSPLNDANMKFKGNATSADITPSVNMVKGSGQLPEAKTVIKGVTNHIDTKSIQKVGNAEAVADKIQSILKSRAAARLGKQASGIGKSFVKGIPVLGGLAVGLGTALSSGDASAGELAATPILSEAEDVGPTPGTLEAKLENGTINADEMQQLLARSR